MKTFGKIASLFVMLGSMAFVSCQKDDDKGMGDISGAPHYGTYRAVTIEIDGEEFDAVEDQGFDLVMTFHEDGAYDEYNEGYDNYGTRFEWDKSDRSLTFYYAKEGYGAFYGAPKGYIKVHTWTASKLILTWKAPDDEGRVVTSKIIFVKD